MRFSFLLAPALLLAACGATQPEKTTERPLKVLLIPADGGTESGTLADYRPLFDAVARSHGLRFDLKVAQSYSAVVEAMCNGVTDIAFVGPITYLQAERRGCAELLAVAVRDGRSVYYAGLFVPRDSPIGSIQDVRGKSIALGDVNSASAFVFPVTMLLDAGINPARDLARVRLTGTHAGSLTALIEHRVDVAGLSFESYAKAVREGMRGARDVRLVARSEPIPNPPLIMSRRLDPAIRSRLKRAFGGISDDAGVNRASIRGYGGAVVDGYDAHFPSERFAPAARKMALVSDDLRNELIRRAGER